MSPVFRLSEVSDLDAAMICGNLTVKRMQMSWLDLHSEEERGTLA